MSSGEGDGRNRHGLIVEEREAAWEPPATEESPEELLRRCADLRDVPAWERFIRRFNPLIVGTVARIMRAHGFDGGGLADDLAQDVYLKLASNHAKVLREFKVLYPGGVFGYLRVIAANVAYDYFKSRAGRQPDSSQMPDDVAGRDEMEWKLLLREIDDLLRKANALDRDRHIFWLYYRQGMSAKEIASISSLNLTTEGVESVVVRLNRLVRKAFENGGRQ